ncbi:hypothetical protein C5F49_04425 [Nitrosopumilus oxyclinae]|uniref:Archaeal Type IV pilin N-terminal domain-containing protein n=2 Tax=Nitrosopumilus oxyclinae TaxID=1959104 RepID=A0A7D5R375_9ARCH|nr:hypothetical protein C5F49_04425 [Nitrosopumilus oxyclinae]
MISHDHSDFFSCKKRKALSTVVTSAILMAAVSIMGVMLVTWSNTSLFTQQIEIENSFNEKMNKLNEDIFIENIWFGNSSPETLNVTLSNVGIIGLNITSIRVSNSSGFTLFSITDGGVSPNAIYSFNTTYFWDAGETTDFIITTNRGNSYNAQTVT